MTTITVAGDARYRKAVDLAAHADRIIPIVGENAFYVPASQGGYYRVDQDGCPCADALYRGTVCKHQIAVAMLRVGSAAVAANTARDEQRKLVRQYESAFAHETATQASAEA